VALGVALALGGCGTGQAEDGPARRLAAVRAPVVGAGAADPSRGGCEALRGLGTSGTPDRYRGISATLAGAADPQLAAAALVLHDATGTSLQPVETRAQRLTMLTAVLGLAEECLRVTG
jgi:hypothetical protein